MLKNNLEQKENPEISFKYETEEEKFSAQKNKILIFYKKLKDLNPKAKNDIKNEIDNLKKLYKASQESEIEIDNEAFLKKINHIK